MNADDLTNPLYTVSYALIGAMASGLTVQDLDDAIMSPNVETLDDWCAAVEALANLRLTQRRAAE